ncbi:2-hydroxyacid dehydrogenase [Roseateles toxinivorans]|uniref:Glyoxylate/hydroxypyruvate reductase A n=1 Tax=Roseateles toxinivorans TaxID=270368 RepID=A0A4R6QPT2_9BURK|nr:glyoxylate/hydroxypyruvate reductase A [Roseateles toxinivorans]TDP72890.1 glyoxylate/hydroxypyruvate reductase A [Roseateles toxinivorans]
MSILFIGGWQRGNAKDEAERTQWLQVLQLAMPGEDWVEQVTPGQEAQIEVAVVANPPQGSLQDLPGLRLIQSLWAGVDRLLTDTSLPAEVPLARMVDPAMNEAMVQTALWAVLALHRGFYDVQHQQQQALWQAPAQCRAHEWRVLVLGLGELGGRVAGTLAHLGYDVCGWSTRPATIAGVRTGSGEAELAQLLAEADTVINLLPLTDQTRGFFAAARFAAMKRGSTLVNLARGAHVIEADLLVALDSGQLSRAVLDVFSVEPLPAAHPFWAHPKITVLPHTAAQTDPRSAAEVVKANLAALREGRPLAHLVARSKGY